jgi:hypothetical protein
MMVPVTIIWVCSDCGNVVLQRTQDDPPIGCDNPQCSPSGEMENIEVYPEKPIVC